MDKKIQCRHPRKKESLRLNTSGIPFFYTVDVALAGSVSKSNSIENVYDSVRALTALNN